jgi:hypothetical protein
MENKQTTNWEESCCEVGSGKSCGGRKSLRPVLRLESGKVQRRRRSLDAVRSCSGRRSLDAEQWSLAAGHSSRGNVAAEKWMAEKSGAWRRKGRCENDSWTIQTF